MIKVHNTDTNFNTIANGSYFCEWRVVFDPLDSTPTTIGMDGIVSGTISASLLNGGSFNVGGVISKELNIELYLGNYTPRTSAMLNLDFRIVSTNNTSVYSHWYTKGTFFIDTRKTDHYGVTTLVCYDALPTLDIKGYSGTGTLSPKTIAEQIFIGYLGGNPYYVTYYDDNDVTDVSIVGFNPANYSVRENLAYTSACSIGNWIITPDNKLRLFRFDDFEDVGQVDIGVNCTSFTYGRALIITQVVLHTVSGDVVATATVNNGVKLEINLPFGDQYMANLILSNLNDYIYKPYSANGCIMLPNYDLGDLITVNNQQFQILQMVTTIGKHPTIDIETPTVDGCSHELVPSDSTYYN